MSKKKNNNGIFWGVFTLVVWLIGANAFKDDGLNLFTIFWYILPAALILFILFTKKW